MLVIAGEHDLPGIVTLCGQLASVLPNARLTTIAGTAHCPALDQPDALNDAVLEFVASIG